MQIRERGVVAILSKANQRLVPCLLCVWFAHWLTRAWERAGRSHQFFDDLSSSSYEIKVAAVIAVLVGILTLVNSRERLLRGRNPAPSSAWTAALKVIPRLYKLQAIYLMTSCMTLLFFSGFFAACIFDDSVKALACLTSDLKQYELAERIYRLAPDLNKNKVSGRYSSMAAWHASSTQEDALTLQQKNSAVATVYGSQSLEMAGRYFFIGLCFENDKNGKRVNDAEAVAWHAKALRVYEQNHAITKCVDALAQMAIYENRKPERERIFAQAERLVTSLDEQPFVSTMLFEHMAKTNGNEKQAELFRKSFEKIQSTNIFPWWRELLACASLVPLAIVGSGFGGLITKRLVLAHLTKSTVSRFKSVADQQLRFEVLHRLIAINLLGRNLSAASHNSKLLIMLAENNRLDASQIDPSTEKISVKLISLVEVSRGLFAILLARSFFI